MAYPAETRPQMLPIVLSLYSSPEEMLDAAMAYIHEKRREEGAKLTWNGLARAIGIDRVTLWDYLRGGKEGLPDAWLKRLKEAASWIEERHEERMFDAACAGSIFWLKNAGWRDTQDVAIGPSDGWQSLIGSMMERDRSTQCIQAEVHEAELLESSATDEGQSRNNGDNPA